MLESVSHSSRDIIGANSLIRRDFPSECLNLWDRSEGGEQPPLPLMMQKVNKKQGRVECKGRRTVVIGRGGGEGVDNSDNFMTDSVREVPTKEGSSQSSSSSSSSLSSSSQSSSSSSSAFSSPSSSSTSTRRERCRERRNHCNHHLSIWSLLCWSVCVFYIVCSNVYHRNLRSRLLHSNIWKLFWYNIPYMSNVYTYKVDIMFYQIYL